MYAILEASDLHGDVGQLGKFTHARQLSRSTARPPISRYNAASPTAVTGSAVTGERVGPPTATEAAAANYEADLNWPVHAWQHEVWLSLPPTMAALIIRLYLADLITVRLTTAIPIISHPALPNSLIFLVRALTVAERDRFNTEEWPTAIHLCHPSMVDLPPTQHGDDTVGWAVAPVPGFVLPRFSGLADTGGFD